MFLVLFIEQVQQRIGKEKSYKSMFVYFATDVQVDELQKAVWDANFYYKEHLVCEIRLYSDGRFV